MCEIPRYLPMRNQGLPEYSEMIDPAVAPAAVKQATVARVGMLPGRLTTTNGSSLPVTCPIRAEYLYFAFWYTENDKVLPNVKLKNGPRPPMREMQRQPGY